MTDARIKAVKAYASRGYSSAGAAIKPWIIYLDGRKVVDKSGRPRRFATRQAAEEAAMQAVQYTSRRTEL